MINKADIVSFFDEIHSKKILVIGDVMLDKYFFGRIDRISPEAPVPVVNVNDKSMRLGGAANVALNLKALGVEAHLLAIRGEDKDGENLESLLSEKAIASSLVKIPSRPTTVKTRIISKNQQVLRVDEESTEALSEESFDMVKKAFTELMSEPSFDAIVLQDYDKGLFSEGLIQFIIEKAKEKNIPVSVDPKKKHFSNYNSCTLFKPNLKEAKEGLNIDIDAYDSESVLSACKKLATELGASSVLITLSENGLIFYSRDAEGHIAAHKRNIADVSGAGDTFISVLSAGLAIDSSLLLSSQLANVASGLVCEEVGVVPLNLEKLKEEAIEVLC